MAQLDRSSATFYQSAIVYIATELPVFWFQLEIRRQI